MTTGQQLRHSIARLALVRSCPKYGEPDHQYVRVYKSELQHLDRVLDALKTHLDDNGVPPQSYTVEVRA